ncbi:unnamed protein product, partial [Staurois parvus]
MPPTSAHQCLDHLCRPSCRPSVSSTTAHQCHPPCRLSVPIIAAYQCSIISASSSMPTSTVSLVPPHQCSLSVPISAAYPCHLISAHLCCLS